MTPAQQLAEVSRAAGRYGRALRHQADDLHIFQLILENAVRMCRADIQTQTQAITEALAAEGVKTTKAALAGKGGLTLDLEYHAAANPQRTITTKEPTQ